MFLAFPLDSVTFPILYLLMTTTLLSCFKLVYQVLLFSIYYLDLFWNCKSLPIQFIFSFLFIDLLFLITWTIFNSFLNSYYFLFPFASFFCFFFFNNVFIKSFCVSFLNLYSISSRFCFSFNSLLIHYNIFSLIFNPFCFLSKSSAIFISSLTLILFLVFDFTFKYIVNVFFLFRLLSINYVDSFIIIDHIPLSPFVDFCS